MKQPTYRVALLTGALALLGAGCGTPPVTPDTACIREREAQMVIGPAGGVLRAGCATLTVPAGALAEATTLTVTMTDLPAARGFTALSPGYRFEPASLEFATPASLSIGFEGTDSDAAVFLRRGEYERLASTLDRGFAHASVPHLGLAGVGRGMPLHPTEKLDLLVMIDNSGGMREKQAKLMRAFGTLLNTLTNPPDTDADGDGYPDVVPVRDLHIGIVSSDLGTAGSSVPGCQNGDRGDDGRLNPIRFGGAMAEHLPWIPRGGDPAPADVRPRDCVTRDEFPLFIAFDSGTAPGQFEHDFRCNAGLDTGGCGLEQPLESVWRALVWHDAREREGNPGANAGFLRDDAVLAILLLTDEEDGSVRDCRFARGDACAPAGGGQAIDVFELSSNRWASSFDLNQRLYLYESCGAQDPTWQLDRYVDPYNLSRGWMGLKPGHPERIVFGAITGVPLGTGATGTTDWDALLGTPGGVGPDDFCARNSTTAVERMSTEGPISMRQANPDPDCPMRVVPACRAEGTTYDSANPTCASNEQPFAWPARRIVEIARRFDQSPMCNGAPCHNGMVASICGNDFDPALAGFASRIQRRLLGP
jgi:hypothetical protein